MSALNYVNGLRVCPCVNHSAHYLLHQPARAMPSNFAYDNKHAQSSTKPFVHHIDGSATLFDGIRPQDVGKEKLVIVMVGLPARGKSYVTKKLCRYLSWLQHDTKIFNVGDRRRKIGQDVVTIPIIESKSSQPSRITDHASDHSAKFFNPENEEASQLRERAAMGTLDELLDYLLYEGGCVSIFDATNSTVKRRNLIMKNIRARAPDLQVMFLESQCVN